MKVHSASFVVAVLFAAFTYSIQASAQADTFGTSGNEFTIDFVDIGNAGNAADTAGADIGRAGYGAVPYEYRVSTYEITQNAITKATASGMANVTAGPWTGNQPAANIDWYEAAAFVNFLNTNSGKTAAYDLTFSSGSWSMALWSSEQAWTAGGTNLYRNKDAYYFLPARTSGTRRRITTRPARIISFIPRGATVFRRWWLAGLMRAVRFTIALPMFRP